MRRPGITFTEKSRGARALEVDPAAGADLERICQEADTRCGMRFEQSETRLRSCVCARHRLGGFRLFGGIIIPPGALTLRSRSREAPSSATLGTQPREPARGRSSHIRRIMGGAIKCTVLVPLIPIVVWCRIMVANETEENVSETETESPVQASEIRKPECLNSLIRQLVQGIFCDAG